MTRMLRALSRTCTLTASELYACSAISQGSIAATRNAFSTTSTSASAEEPQSPSAASKPSSPDTTRRRRRRYKPEVLEYFARVKQWNKQMSALKDEWRTELLLKHQAKRSQQQALKILTSNQSQEERVQEPQQVQQALEEELRKTELEVELATIKLQRARRFETAQAHAEKAQEQKRAALLEASRTWIRREELLDRINSALDSPLPFGFVAPIPDAKKVL